MYDKFIYLYIVCLIDDSFICVTWLLDMTYSHVWLTRSYVTGSVPCHMRETNESNASSAPPAAVYMCDMTHFACDKVSHQINCKETEMSHVTHIHGGRQRAINISCWIWATMCVIYLSLTPRLKGRQICQKRSIYLHVEKDIYVCAIYLSLTPRSKGHSTWVTNKCACFSMKRSTNESKVTCVHVKRDLYMCAWSPSHRPRD